MKKIFYIVFALILSIGCQNAFSQQFEDVVKFLPTNLHYNQATFEWEHQEKRNSLIVGIGIPYHHSIIDRSFGEFVPTSANFKSADLYSYSVRVGYRHYITNNDPFGLYVECYIKSQTMDWNVSIKNNDHVAGVVKGYFYGVAPGVQIGYQEVFWKHFIMDLYVIGFEVNNANGNATSYSQNETDAQYTRNFVSNLANQHLPNNANFKSSGGSNDYSYNYKLSNFAYPHFRLGISVGYRF